MCGKHDFYPLNEISLDRLLQTRLLMPTINYVHETIRIMKCAIGIHYVVLTTLITLQCHIMQLNG